MAKHEFGIMMDAPQQGKRYDEYEPFFHGSAAAYPENG